MDGLDPERRYVIGSPVAVGGMGAIFRARDRQLHRAVAMKQLRDGAYASLEKRSRFLQEARVLAQLEHPNIVPIHDLGVDEHGQVYYTMKFIQGITLLSVVEGLRVGDAEVVARYPLSQLLTIFQKVCDAIAFAHSKGVVHRDLKPDNIMLGSFGEVLVMDWGLAKILSAEPAPDSAEAAAPETESPSPGTSSLTMEGAVMGTLQFMAPEQAEGRNDAVDARTDIYALGALLYNLLTLRTPVTGVTVDEVLANIKRGYIPPPVFYNRPGTTELAGVPADDAVSLPHCPEGRIPGSLSAVAMKALARSPAHRYQTVEELQRDIAAHQSGFATAAEEASSYRLAALFVKRHRTAAITALAALLVLTGLGAVVVVSERRAQATLTRLRATAPAHFRLAQACVAEKRFDQALEKIESALELRPDLAEYHCWHGHIHQSRLELVEAREAYRQTLRLAPGYALAAENLNLCERLLAEKQQDKLPDEGLRELQEAMLRQERIPEAIALAERLNDDAQRLFRSCEAALARAGVSGKLSAHPMGGLELNLYGSGIKDLSALRALPLTGLNLTYCTNVADLSPLRGTKLKTLGMPHTAVSDLIPLQGMPLQALACYHTRVHSLTALEGMPLRDLNVSHTLIRDFHGVRQMTNLVSVSLVGLELQDLGFLRGLPLRALWVGFNPIADLNPLRGMPLYELDLRETKVVDLSPLAGMPLQGLFLGGTKVQELRPLRGMRLTTLDLARTAVREVDALRGMPLGMLWLDGCVNLKDLAPLTECPQLECLTVPASIKEVEVLRSVPTLKRLSYTAPDGGDWSRCSTAAEFWSAYDARKGRR